MIAALLSRIGLSREASLVISSARWATRSRLCVSSTSEQNEMPVKRQPRWLGASPSSSTRALRWRVSR
jgi:hypothetical protein